MKEDKASWVNFFQWLRGRGLDGVKLVVGDKCLGIVLQLHSGSSPRVRGLCKREEENLKHQRFIPACAGLIDRQTALTQIWPVHPRVCGAYAAQGYEIPKMIRFIPACAGLIAVGFAQFSGRPVHPRVCGAYILKARNLDIDLGSSPRVRGLYRRHD